uniref:Uncharacterized protein n=1 Tax=Grammatophora oceanica TaxID=210454 RepID=A0A7S1VKT1_9STRA|mmetsp:Transcript_49226/g.73393  ORF Transcript_49226/g.73393 Transcript_49226/m.73393 type:complete len:123 (+) Transcript_49226:323-691(+)
MNLQKLKGALAEEFYHVCDVFLDHIHQSGDGRDRLHMINRILAAKLKEPSFDLRIAQETVDLQKRGLEVVFEALTMLDFEVKLAKKASTPGASFVISSPKGVDELDEVNSVFSFDDGEENEV